MVPFFLRSLAFLALVAALDAEPLFNGRDLDGWRGDPRLWRVEDGVILGETDAAERRIEANSFLIWEGGEVGDFELTFEARVEGNNSGIQYRSRVLDDSGWRMAGYQLDLHPRPEYLGMLYEEAGRGILGRRGQRVELRPTPRVAGTLPVPAVDLAEWHTYRIVATDQRLQHFIDGRLAAEVIDFDPQHRRRTGRLGIQLHAGPPMRVELKNLELKQLSGPAHRAPEGVEIAPGYDLEKLYAVPKSQGSWVSMTLDDEGRLICADQYGGLYRVAITDPVSVEKWEVPIGGAHGVLWHDGALFVAVNERVGGPAGVYRFTDRDGDGVPEHLAPIRTLRGRGEHGPHSLVASPDGQWIYFVAGNHTDLPAHDHSWVPEVWDEDQLLPSLPDARGHASDRLAPGGWIARFRPDGSRWELVSVGYRNAYDLAFAADGTPFTYDSDMEWDLGMPWYRPTRICQVLPGSDYGWRHGSAKWPDYYEDSIPAVLDIGPGSPTALLSAAGAHFPAAAQRRLYAFDWTFGTVHAITLERAGHGHTASSEEWIAGPAMPFTAATVGPDGHVYALTGGRRIASALWRVRYIGADSTEPIEPPEAPARTEPRLDDSDRVGRYLARTRLERDQPAALRAQGGKPWAVIQRALGLARVAGAEHQAWILDQLLGLDWAALDLDQRLTWLRAAGLAFIRGDGPTATQRQAVLDQIDGAYPGSDPLLNRELCRMLCALQAPGVVGRTLALMDAGAPEPRPDWAELASRNRKYGSTIQSMLERQPSAQVLHFAYCLRCVEGPWTADERKRFLGWLQRLGECAGGASYQGFLQRLRQDTLRLATAEERAAIATLPDLPPADPLADLPAPEGPGRAWTVAAVLETLETGPGRPDHGATMFRAGLCAACHGFGGRGGGIGPDLTLVSGRFDARALAEAILHPSREISDQYQFEQFTREDGSCVVGRATDEKDGKIIVQIHPYDPTQTEEVARAELVERRPSPVSPMPSGLIHAMNAQEVRDLFAYLLGPD